jgi:hypothetical protein
MAARPDHWCRVPQLDVLANISVDLAKNMRWVWISLELFCGVLYCHVFVWLSTGFWIGYSIYWPLTHTTWNYKLLQGHR